MFGMKIKDIYNLAIQGGVSSTDAKHLISGFCDFSLAEFGLRKEDSLSESMFLDLKTKLQRAKNGEPVYRVLGWREFYGRQFCLNEATLEPRPDSEILIETILEKNKKDDSLKILEFGTGTGCLILTLLKEFPNATGIATDISERALECAKKNAENLGVSNRVQFLKDDMLNSKIIDKFDLVVSNPPYISSEDVLKLDENVQKFDPNVALDGGKDGLDFYRAIAEKTPSLLKEGGSVILEIGYDQADSVPKLFSNLSQKEIIKDYGGNPRVFKGIL